MRTTEIIPEAVRICERCWHLASGECETCARVDRCNAVLEARMEADRVGAFYGSLPQLDAGDEQLLIGGGLCTVSAWVGLIVLGWCAVIGLARCCMVVWSWFSS